MPAKVPPVPKGLRTVTPNLTCRDAAKAVAFYEKAFGAKELARFLMPDGKIGHSELELGDSRVFVNDEMPGMAPSPQTLKGTPVGFFVYVADADALYKRAVAAGCKATMPIADMFWGDRCGMVEDPFGHRWTISTHIEDLTPEETRRRGEAFFKKPAAKA